MTARASDEFQKKFKLIYVQPANCSLKRPRSPSTEPICSPERSPGRSQDENQNPIKVLCRPALDRAMSNIRNRGPDPHQCFFCGSLFPNDEGLQAHRRIPHSYTCDECPRRFATRSELYRHHLNVAEAIKREDQTSDRELGNSSHVGKEKSQPDVLLLDSSVPSSPLLSQEPVHNSHDQDSESNKTEDDKNDESCSQISSSPSSPGFLQYLTAGKDKFHDDQNFNDFLSGVVTIISDSDSGEDRHSDEAPELKMSSDDESISSSFPQKSHLSSSLFPQEEGDDRPNIEPKIEISIEENLVVEPPLDSIEVKNEPKNNPPLQQKQKRTTEGHVSHKCIQCGVSIRLSNFASNSGIDSGGEELKCFQCQPQIFFRTLCPICEKQVETVSIQYHLEHAHHEVDVLPCKMCQQMMGKHDIIPHMKVCGENGGKSKVLCPLCKKDMLKTSLALHMQTHMNRPKQQCPHCDSKVLNLKLHIMRKHANVQASNGNM